MDISNLLLISKIVSAKVNMSLTFLFQQEQLVYHLIHGNAKQFGVLLNRLHSPDVIQEVLCLAATVGQINIINLIVESHPVEYNSLYLLACESEQLQLVKHLLPRIDNEMDGLHSCIINGYLELIKCIVNIKSVDLTFDDNVFIRLASFYGHTNIVQYLLNDERVDPASGQNESLKNACKYGYIEIAKLLIQDDRVDLLAVHNIALELAISNGHQELAVFLHDYAKISAI
ncbi:hypothetical protein HDV01_003484 [Terramyces sp. JEL0728]|nr:hypothetical protein HDV01_003484 [Terramyces sp. JEL0728]